MLLHQRICNMTLINKLKTANRPFLPRMKNETVQTIKEFYDTFIYTATKLGYIVSEQGFTQ